nr:phosphotransferase [Flexivirga aerilata]
MVQGTETHRDDRFQVAYLTTDDDKEWVVRASLSTAAGAQMEQSDALLKLLAKRLPYALPRIEGSITADDGSTIAVQPRLRGTPSVWRELPAGGDLARAVGSALAVLHDVDPRVVEEAGLPTYDADAYRARRLATLDRAAATGQVPTGLLARWERALEEVTLWKFATCTVHGPLEGAHVLVDGDISAITGWERAGVSDPAEDFAVLSVLAPPESFDTVLEAYAAARRDAPDPHLERRVRLAAELQRVNALLDAVSTDDDDLVRRRASALRRLDEATQDDDSLMPPTPGRRRPAPVEEEPAPAVDPKDIEVVELTDAESDDETVEIPIAKVSDEADTKPEIAGAQGDSAAGSAQKSAQESAETSGRSADQTSARSADQTSARSVGEASAAGATGTAGAAQTGPDDDAEEGPEPSSYPLEDGEDAENAEDAERR